MKRFSVKEVKEKFVSEQVNKNAEYVTKCLSENKPLVDAFYNFSQVEEFLLDSINSGVTNFNFVAYLHNQSNSELNHGEIVFTKEDFEQEIKKQQEESLTSKPVSVKKKNNGPVV